MLVAIISLLNKAGYPRRGYRRATAVHYRMHIRSRFWGIDVERAIDQVSLWGSGPEYRVADDGRVDGPTAGRVAVKTMVVACDIREKQLI